MKIKLCFVFLFLSFITFSQETNREIDSLIVALSKEKNDTIKSRIYIKLVANYQQLNPKKSIKYAFDGLKIVKKMNWDKGFAVFYNDIGTTYLSQAKHKEALFYYKKSLEYSNNFALIKSFTLHNVAVIYFDQKNISMAMKYNNKLYELAKSEKLNDAIAKAYSNYGQIYSSQNKFNEAKKYYLKALEIWKTESNPVQEATALMNLGDITTNVKNKLELYTKSKAIWETENPTHLLAITTNLSIAEEFIKLARNNNLEAIKEVNKTKTELLEKSTHLLTDAVEICKTANYQQNLMYAYGKFSELEEVKGNHKKALEYLNLNIELYEKIFSQENKNKIATVENQKIIALKNQEIQFKNQEKQNQKIYFSSIILLLLIIGSWLVIQNRNRKKTNEKLVEFNLALDAKNHELDKANKNKALFFSILNHDLRSPVSNLIDFLHLQKSSPDLLDEQTKNEIEKSTLASAENLLHSMEDILVWSKSQMENFKPQPNLLEINQIFEELKNYFLSEKNIQIIFENPQNIQLKTDENYLKTIMRNLTANAIKATKQVKSPVIVWKAWQEMETVFVSISDNGIGAVVNEFEVLRDKNKISNIQSGLGLHLIRDLAKAINCNIFVDSKINLGTKITLQIIK